jgi:hypothetical protein
VDLATYSRRHGWLTHDAPDRGTYTCFRTDEKTGAQVMVVLSKASTEVKLDPRRFADVRPAYAKGRNLFSGAALGSDH